MVDDQLHFTISEADGDILREFDLFMNLLGQPAAEYRLPDGTIDRESIDGITLSISADGERWTGSNGQREYVYSLNEAGELVYVDENGDAYTIRDHEYGVLSVEAPDGTTAAFVPGLRTDDTTDDLYVFDASGELIDSGSLDPSADDWSGDHSGERRRQFGGGDFGYWRQFERWRWGRVRRRLERQRWQRRVRWSVLFAQLGGDGRGDSGG